MPSIVLAPEVFDDFDRFLDHLSQHGIDDISERIADIIEAIQVLAHSPQIGRKASGGKQELVIGEASRGYVALYRHVPNIDTVIILAIRNQRESAYRRTE